MGIIDKLRRVGGIAKNRLASSVGALRGALGGVTVSGARARRGVRFAARGTRLLTPAGLGLTAVSFAPEIVRGIRTAGRFLGPAITRGIAFFGGRQIVGAGAAGGVAGFLGSRKKGEVTRPSDAATAGPVFPPSAEERRRRGAAGAPRRPGVGFERGPGGELRRVQTTRRLKRRPRAGPKRRVTARRRPKRVTARRRVGRRKRRTHRSPRHRGHKRVSFTTKEGKKVSFLVNPKARHR